MKKILTCMVLLGILTYTLYVIKVAMYEESYYNITCGEALFRHTGSAAPRDSIETYMWNECVFDGRKRWREYDKF